MSWQGIHLPYRDRLGWLHPWATLRLVIVGLWLGAGGIPEVAAEDWNQWRGPDRSNISFETGFLTEWPVEGPPILWELTGLGDGIASVSVAAGRLYTVGYRDGGEFLWCLNALTGEKIRASRLGPPIQDHPLMRWLTQRTPVVDGDRVYTLTAQGVLSCRRTEDGAQIWHRNYQEDFAASRHAFGYNDHPLVDGERLICCPAGSSESVVALDKHTGEVKWSTTVPDTGPNAFGATLVSNIGNLRQYIVKFHNCIAGLAADDGRLLWQYTKHSGRITSSHTPIVYEDKVFQLNPYGQGAALLQLVSHGDSAPLEVREIYEGRILRLSPFQDIALRIGDHLYAAQGASRPVCLELNSGQISWEPLKVNANGLMAMTAADGCLYLRWADGTVALVEATPSEYRPKSTFRIPNVVDARGVTLPVVSHRRLFIRDNNRLICYGISPEMLPGPTVSPRLQLALSPAEQEDTSTREAAEPSQQSDAVYVPTPHDVVKAILDAAGVEPGEIVYDLGSGDGRILIAAARDYEANAVGVEIDVELVKQSQQQAAKLNLTHLVTIRQGNFFAADLQAADVVTVFLPPEVLERLVPQFTRMKRGSRIVSHQFQIPGMKSHDVVGATSPEDGAVHNLYLYKIPEAVPRK